MDLQTTAVAFRNYLRSLLNGSAYVSTGTHTHTPGMFAFRGFLNALMPVFQNSNFMLIYLVIHYQDFYILEFRY